jgi:hypothetical protein
MTFAPKYALLREALRLVAERCDIKKEQRNPLWDALDEAELLPEICIEEEWTRLQNGGWKKISVWFPSPICLDAPDTGQTAHTDIRITMSAIDELWPSGACAAVPAPEGRRGRTGYDWEPFWIEVVRLADTVDGLPDTQAELETTMQKWCLKTWRKEIGESTMREHLSPVYANKRKGQK